MTQFFSFRSQENKLAKLKMIRNAFYKTSLSWTLCFSSNKLLSRMLQLFILIIYNQQFSYILGVPYRPILPFLCSNNFFVKEGDANLLCSQNVQCGNNIWQFLLFGKGSATKLDEFLENYIAIFHDRYGCIYARRCDG